MNLKNLLSGVVALEEASSPVNGKISVMKSIGYGTYFQVGNLTQSGGVMYDIWKTTLKKIKQMTNDPQSVLILGLGGGSCAVISRKQWPYAIITGVDFDKTIVDLGNKYLNLGKTDAEIVVDDANEFIEKSANDRKEYNLILVDLYVGQEFPVAFETDKFIENVGKSLPTGGVAVFNRLYSGEKRPASMAFGKKLEGYFTKVEYFFPEANVMLICTK
ncbi:MAG: hypothetical protein UT39_C0011G0010 [Candidatus Woesebacteria bacterium GW2011_GWA1_39_21]|uniref:Spermidine synthase n=1 Tax=Candidatus Woesebacteria bacterium GW2011_GWA1_39_21 TaxID=1618550 RepID=A0A0G0N6U6_9BACT|nr:MAG: hypothetical protein UT39_C0011G0010 [Candidatus Woesebacteria bacterium GW2011_GWA1_39_21]